MVVDMMTANSSGTVSHINRVYIVMSLAVLRTPMAAKVVSCLRIVMSVSIVGGAVKRL